MLQLWDYFLVSGWKAILKMGLYVLRDSSAHLLQLSFEEILNEINDKPKAILAPNLNESITDEESKEAQAEQEEEFVNIYQRLR